MKLQQLHVLRSTFESVAKKKYISDPLEALILDETISISLDLDETVIQESWSWRNVHLARELALFLIDEKGEIQRRSLFRAIQLLQTHLFSLGPERHHDISHRKHMLKILKLFYDNPDFVYALRRIGRPIGQHVAERLIRETLFLSEKAPVKDTHARQAALSALLTSLRQNVGSCFATAPAILIQQNQPLQFLTDFGQLLGTGQLKRIREGIEYTVPLSHSWGMGDLLRPFYPAALGKNPFKTLALSPGLQRAFEAAGLIEKKETKEKRREACFELFRSCGLAEKTAHPFKLLTPEYILKCVLLYAYKVTEEGVEEFQQKTNQAPFAQLGIHIPFSATPKSLAVPRYLKAFDLAKNAFKSITDNPLLKAWEFTLASLSESKADFAKWNLYISLGVNPEDSYGIGQSLYTLIQNKLHQINEEISEHQSRYDHLFAQAKYLEGRISVAASESELGWARAEYQMRRHEINRALNERDKAYDRGLKLQNLYPFLIQFYGEKIQEYFQEVYDAEMLDVANNPYDDSPAGFRLMYKHGRANTSAWTMIHSPAEYIQHLASFFVATEIQLSQLPQLEGLQKEVSELVTAAIMTIKHPEFLENSLIRLAAAYHEPVITKPLENLDKVKRKPWSYISGGTMNTLVSCYWNHPNKVNEVSRWVESENEYLAFLIDMMKELPLRFQQMYQKDPDGSLLTFSPTHAFLCKPGWRSFKAAWQSDIYTYTWIKDHWMRHQIKFLNSIVLDHGMMAILTQDLLRYIPAGYRAVAAEALKNFAYSMTPVQFRGHVIQVMSYERWLKEGGKLDLLAEELDSILYKYLPLFPEYELREKLESIFNNMDEIDSPLKEKIDKNFSRIQEAIGKQSILTAHDLKDIAKSLLILSLESTRSSINFHQKITDVMRKLGYCYPEPILFADTNWVKNVFGFTINPGTEKLEFWRFDETGSEGRPMSLWKKYLDGHSKEPWGLYISPNQYGETSFLR
jgi:hypothetical protein